MYPLRNQLYPQEVLMYIYSICPTGSVLKFPIFTHLTSSLVRRGKYHLLDGKALSFALRLKNKNNGAAQTQIPKKAATSINPCSPSPLILLGFPYEYRFGDRLLASLALFAKWKNQVKWSAITRRQEARKRGEERDMTGHEEVKFDR